MSASTTASSGGRGRARRSGDRARGATSPDEPQPSPNPRRRVSGVHPTPPSPGPERGRAAGRFASAPNAFALLAECAARRRTIAYADFADRLGFGSPRQLGWLLTPLLDWCRERRLPPLPIIVVRRQDRLPSGGYDLRTVAAETDRVFAYPWPGVTPPTAADLARFALPRLPAGLQAPAPLPENPTC